MSESVPCRGCGRRLKLPATINRAKARCPKCLTRVQPDAPPARRPAPDAYQSYASDSQPLPKPQALSLDDALPPDPKPQPPAPETLHLPPPFRVEIEVHADSLNQLAGAMKLVLTPHGLFFEQVENQPLLYLPPGVYAKFEGRTLTLILPNRRLEFEIRRRPGADQLATDVVEFLAHRRPVPLPAEYRRPWWLVGVGVMFAMSLAPLLLASSDSVVTGLALVVVGMMVNTGLALFTNLPTGAKIGSMAACTALLFGVFLALANPSEIAPLPEAVLAPVPPEVPTPPTPPEEPPEPPPPVTHWEFLRRDGVARFENGPADVTAIATVPGGAVLVAYANGSTRVWELDQPAFEPARLGPRAPSAVRRITFDPSRKFAILSCDSGLVCTPWNRPNAAAVVIPGSQGVAYFEPNRERFGVVRGDRVHVRYLPMSLIRNPPLSRVRDGFLTTLSQDETIPLNYTAQGVTPAGGPPTFLAWDTAGKLLAGRPDGTLAFLPPSASVLSSELRSTVRAWDQSPSGDFAFGDEQGFVGVWPAGSTSVTKFRAGRSRIQTLSFTYCGELVVADDVGRVSLWHPNDGSNVFEVSLQSRVTVIARTDCEDVILLATGRNVEAWWLPKLATRKAP